MRNWILSTHELEYYNQQDQHQQQRQGRFDRSFLNTPDTAPLEIPPTPDLPTQNGCLESREAFKVTLIAGRTAHINTVHSPRINDTLAHPHYTFRARTQPATSHVRAATDPETQNCSHLYRRLERIQEARELQRKVSSFSQVATFRQETQTVLQDGGEC